MVACMHAVTCGATLASYSSEELSFVSDSLTQFVAVLTVPSTRVLYSDQATATTGGSSPARKKKGGATAKEGSSSGGGGLAALEGTFLPKAIDEFLALVEGQGRVRVCWI